MSPENHKYMFQIPQTRREVANNTCAVIFCKYAKSLDLHSGTHRIIIIRSTQRYLEYFFYTAVLINIFFYTAVLTIFRSNLKNNYLLALGPSKSFCMLYFISFAVSQSFSTLRSRITRVFWKYRCVGSKKNFQYRCVEKSKIRPIFFEIF